MKSHDHAVVSALPVAVTRPFVIEGVVFLCGAATMVLELVGSRLLAPYFGNSIFVWTSLIGVILGFMALGSYLGGQLGDRRLSGSVRFWILISAALAVLLISFTEGFVVPKMAQSGGLRTGAVIAAIALFALPSTVLGMVTPYCIRLRLHAIADSGSTVGSLYAISTLGSIVGTFAAGFWLIALIGSHEILVWIAAVPGALSLLFIAPITWKRGGALLSVVAVLLGAAFLSHSSIESFDTQYDRYFLRRGTDIRSGRPVLALSRDMAGAADSIVYADNGEPFVPPYQRYYNLALDLVPEVRHTLVIGGGAFSYPRLQLGEHPSSRVDVVEIDPALVKVARSYFFLTDDSRMRIILEDGRVFLDRESGSYDAIVIDALKSRGTVPYQLSTRESFEHCSRLLNDHGVLAINVIASVDGPGSRFASAEYATLASVFPQVAVFAIEDLSTSNLGAVQNISMLACKDPSFDLAAEVRRISPDLAAHRVSPDALLPGVPILTDDFAPADQYLSGI